MTDPMHPETPTDGGYTMLLDGAKAATSFAALVVRVVGPYLACAAITLGIVTALDVKELREQDKVETDATFIARCERGNARAAAQLSANREGTIAFGLAIIERAPALGIDVNDPEVRAELVTAGNEIFEQAFDSPDLEPTDCSTIIDVEVTSTTTTTP